MLVGTERYKVRVARTLFRIGPVLALIPLIVWSWAWCISQSDENQAWYIWRPIEASVALVFIWHVALIVVEKSKRYIYLGYAVVFLPAYLFAAFIGMISATRFPL